MRKVGGGGGGSHPHVSSHASGMPGILGGQGLAFATAGGNVGGVQMRRLGSAGECGYLLDSK